MGTNQGFLRLLQESITGDDQSLFPSLFWVLPDDERGRGCGVVSRALNKESVSHNLIVQRRAMMVYRDALETSGVSGGIALISFQLREGERG